MTLKEYDAIIEQSKNTILDSLKQPTLTDDDVAGWLNYFKRTLSNYAGMEKFASIFDSAEEIVRSSNWIPVTERLPEMSGFYFVTKENDYGKYVTVDFFYQDKTWYAESNPTALSTGWRVTAWMPLPEPYEGSE